jgi:Fur family transcriptional regulator, iron response regulator
MAPVRTRSHSKVAETAARSSSPPELASCPWHDVKVQLRNVGLRPTYQRIALWWLLFCKGNRHITAEMLHLEATQAKVSVSVATVYNTLHQFTSAGILRQLAFDGSKSFFDTNTGMHHHFFAEGENLLIDIAVDDLALEKIPTPPESCEIARIEVAIRLRAKRS